MAYDLRAIVGPHDVVRSVVNPAFAAPVELAQGFSLRPLLDDRPEPFEPFDAFDAEAVQAALVDTFGTPDGTLVGTPDGMVQHGGPVAFVGIETFGGPSADCAVVWHEGRVIFAEAVEDEAEMYPSQVAFRLIGVRAAPGLDEFATLGLGRHHSTQEWCAATGAPDEED